MPKNAPLVVFDHEKHVNGIGLKYTGYHYQILKIPTGPTR